MPTPAPTITTSFLLLWHSDAWLSEAVFWLASVLAGQKLDTVRMGVEVGDEVGLEVEDDELRGVVVAIAFVEVDSDATALAFTFPGCIDMEVPFVSEHVVLEIC